MLLIYKNHKPLRYKSQVKQQVSEASGSILVVDVVEPDLYDLNLRMLRLDHVRDIHLVAVPCLLLSPVPCILFTLMQVLLPSHMHSDI